jgi:hypothetical protein
LFAMNSFLNGLKAHRQLITTGAREGYNPASFAIEMRGTRMGVHMPATVDTRRFLRWRNSARSRSRRS